MRTDVTDRGGGAAPPAREGLVVLFVASIGTHGLEGNVVLFVASIGTHGAFAYRGESVRRGVFFQYHSRHIEQPDPALSGFRNHYLAQQALARL